MSHFDFHLTSDEPDSQVLRKVDDAAVDQQIESVDKELGDPKAGE